MSNPTHHWALVVAALRSGDYTQGKDYLTRLDPVSGRPRALCCLGVACEVAMANGVPLVVGTQSVVDGQIRTYADPAGDETPRQGDLPHAVQAWLGVTTGDPKVVDLDHASGQQIALSRANDGRPWGFARIADAIDQTYVHPTPRTALEALTAALKADSEPAHVLDRLRVAGWVVEEQAS